MHIRPKRMNKILYYSLRSIFYDSLIALSRQGKGYPTLKEDDIICLKFDRKIINKLFQKQEQLNKQIQTIEEKIRELKNQIEHPLKIVNRVFAREFGFEENLYNEFGKGMTAGTQIAKNRSLRVFETDFKDFSRSNKLRFSTRFHNPLTNKLMDLLDRIKTLQVKDILKESIHRGASPQYNPDGNIPVVKTDHLKNGYIEIPQDEFVDEEFYESTPNSQIRKGDILIASTGKSSMGKVDLWEYYQEAVADSHITIVRIDGEKYNPLFFTYFFRSILGYFQIERDYTGTTNQIELNVDEIANFRVPDVPLDFQQKVVDEIKSELQKQDEIKSKIEDKRNEIEQIIREIAYNDNQTSRT